MIDTETARPGVMRWIGTRLRRLRQRRARRLTTLQHLATQLPLDEVTWSPFPVPTLSARHTTYPFTLSVTMKESWIWRIHAELHHDWESHLLLTGDARPAKMRELYGKEVLFTDDKGFDRQVIVASSAPTETQQLLTPYLRSRFCGLPHTHFQIEIRKKAVIAEVHTRPEKLATVHAFVDLLFCTLGMLDLVISNCDANPKSEYLNPKQ
jgi:hypothetical protein